MAYKPLPSESAVEEALSYCTTTEAREYFYSTLQENLNSSDLKDRSVPIIDSLKEANQLSESVLYHKKEAWVVPKQYMVYGYFKSKDAIASPDISNSRKERYQQAMQQIEDKCKSSDVTLDENLAQSWLEQENSFSQLQENFVNWYQQATKAPEDLNIEALVEGPFVKKMSSLESGEPAPEAHRDEV